MTLSNLRELKPDMIEIYSAARDCLDEGRSRAETSTSEASNAGTMTPVKSPRLVAASSVIG